MSPEYGYCLCLNKPLSYVNRTLCASKRVSAKRSEKGTFRWPESRDPTIELSYDAKRVLAAIQSLYRIEQQAKAAGLVGADLVALREREAGPMLASLGNLFDAIAQKYRPKSLIARAIGYARGQWPAIKRYVEVADARIDNNNSSEQAIKPVVIGRKNWMFAGSAEGAPHASAEALLGMAKRNDTRAAPSTFVSNESSLIIGLPPGSTRIR